jgi:radical SAM protein with 4Fe4S-binding SPASM domain
MEYKRKIITNNDIFNRKNSTVSYMDDFQIALHTFDGCVKSCTGCVVNTDTRELNNLNGGLLITPEQAKIIHKNVKEAYEISVLDRMNNNDNENSYFGKNSRKVNNFSYTYRFGNHSQINIDTLEEYVNILDTEYNIFSSGAGYVPHNIIELSKKYSEKRFFVEFIFDPIKDNIEDVIKSLITTRENGVIGYLEMIITKSLIEKMPSEEFNEKVLKPLNDALPFGIQLQLGKYMPSKNRKFSHLQVPPLTMETKWLKEVATIIVKNKYQIYVLPLGEFAVTLLDDFRQVDITKELNTSEEELKVIREKRLNEFSMENFINSKIPSVLDIMKTSLYIDNNLDVYIWSEDIGQHTLDSQFNYTPIGNLYKQKLVDILNNNKKLSIYYLNKSVSFLNDTCKSCPLIDFCATHSIELFRNEIKDNDIEVQMKNCYGYIDVIESFKDREYLDSMIEDFRGIDF